MSLLKRKLKEHYNKQGAQNPVHHENILRSQ